MLINSLINTRIKNPPGENNRWASSFIRGYHVEYIPYVQQSFLYSLIFLVKEKKKFRLIKKFISLPRLNKNPLAPSLCCWSQTKSQYYSWIKHYGCSLLVKFLYASKYCHLWKTWPWKNWLSVSIACPRSSTGRNYLASGKIIWDWILYFNSSYRFCCILFFQAQNLSLW